MTATLNLKLVEQQPTRLPPDALTLAQAEQIWARYDKQIELREPSRQTQHQWQIMSDGWVGLFPVTPTLHISVQPKLPLQSLFGMWEYVFELDLLFKSRELYRCETIEAFYNRLAQALAQRVIERTRKGLAHQYVQKRDTLPFLNGRLLTHEHARKSVMQHMGLTLPCEFEEHTPNIERNQLLLWALHDILRGRQCDSQTQSMVRHAYRAIAPLVTLVMHPMHVFANQHYDRLTHDYKPMHVLCQFFLEQVSPSHLPGDHTALPFQTYMPRLFERFVAAWLGRHLPSHFHVTMQESVPIGNVLVALHNTRDLNFKIDLVLHDRNVGEVSCVLDTKYKDTVTPAAEDIQQIVTYAELKRCDIGVLIYPNNHARGRFVIGNKQIYVLGFDMARDLAQAGTDFIARLLGALHNTRG
jgi:5-methylcytosine-specific restriction enzyme subunit McrC